MSRFRVVAWCFLTLLILPLVCSAQSELRESSQPPFDNTASQVSVRELYIPGKAIKAFNKGTRLLAAKDAAASIPEFQQAIKVFPGFYEAYYKIGIAEFNLQRTGEAQLAFDKSIELSDARYAPPYFALGLLLSNENQLAEAEAAVRTGLDLAPTDATGNFTLAWVLFAAARLPDAEKSARQAVLYGTKFAMAYLLLAQIHMRLNNPSALVEDLDAYLQLEPDGPLSSAARTIRAHAQQLLSP